MIAWTDDFNGWVGTIIKVYIAQRADGLLDVTITTLGGDGRRLCGGSLDDAHEVAEQLCAIELPSVRA